MRGGSELLLAVGCMAAVAVPLVLARPANRADSARSYPIPGQPPPPEFQAGPMSKAYQALQAAEAEHQARFLLAFSDDAGWSALRTRAADAAKEHAPFERQAVLGKELFLADVPPDAPRKPLQGANRCAACHAHGRPGGPGGFVDDTYQGLNPPALDGDGLIERLAAEISADLAAQKTSGAKQLRSHGIDFGSPSRPSGIGADLVVRPFGRRGRWATLQEAVTVMTSEAVGFKATRPEVEDLAAFVAGLPTPEIDPPDASRLTDLYLRFQAGSESFVRVGCATCHLPAIPLKDGTVAHPFSDLKVHDMGPRLAFKGDSKWLTPPLWTVATSAPYLHDGTALSSLDQAILMHDGEGAAAAAAYRALTGVERGSIKTYLLSLTTRPQIRIAGP